jgi:hypothetical protein
MSIEQFKMLMETIGVVSGDMNSLALTYIVLDFLTGPISLCIVFYSLFSLVKYISEADAKRQKINKNEQQE